MLVMQMWPYFTTGHEGKSDPRPSISLAPYYKHYPSIHSLFSSRITGIAGLLTNTGHTISLSPRRNVHPLFISAATNRPMRTPHIMRYVHGAPASLQAAHGVGRLRFKSSKIANRFLTSNSQQMLNSTVLPRLLLLSLTFHHGYSAISLSEVVYLLAGIQGTFILSLISTAIDPIPMFLWPLSKLMKRCGTDDTAWELIHNNAEAIEEEADDIPIRRTRGRSSRRQTNDNWPQFIHINLGMPLVAAGYTLAELQAARNLVGHTAVTIVDEAIEIRGRLREYARLSANERPYNPRVAIFISNITPGVIANIFQLHVEAPDRAILGRASIKGELSLDDLLRWSRPTQAQLRDNVNYFTVTRGVRNGVYGGSSTNLDGSFLASPPTNAPREVIQTSSSISVPTWKLLAVTGKILLISDTPSASLGSASTNVSALSLKDSRYALSVLFPVRIKVFVLTSTSTRLV